MSYKYQFLALYSLRNVGKCHMSCWNINMRAQSSSILTFKFNTEANMAIIGRCLLHVPRALLTVFAIDPFSLGKIPLRSVILNVFQFYMTLTGILVMKDFQSVDADLWITCICCSQVRLIFKGMAINKLLLFA